MPSNKMIIIIINSNSSDVCVELHQGVKQDLARLRPGTMRLHIFKMLKCSELKRKFTSNMYKFVFPTGNWNIKSVHSEEDCGKC